MFGSWNSPHNLHCQRDGEEEISASFGGFNHELSFSQHENN